MQLLFVIATNVTRAEDDDPAIKDLRAGTHRPGTGTAKKRALNGDASGRTGSARKVIRRVASSTTQQSRDSGATSVSRQPTASVPNSNNTGIGGNECLPMSSHPLDQEDEPPLFLPSQTQLTAADISALSQSAQALGMESMTADEFAAMLDDEGEEVEMAVEPSERLITETGESAATTMKEELECDELDDEEMLNDSEMGPTQSEELSASDKVNFYPIIYSLQIILIDYDLKTFRPLFED